MCCIHSSKSFKSVFCCIPLAPFVLAVSAVLGVWSALEIRSIVLAHLSSGESYNFSSGLGLALACFRGLAALLGFVAVLLKNPCGMNLLRIAVKMLIASSVITFLIQWIYWILWFSGIETDGGVSLEDGRWRPTKDEIVYMSLFTFFNVALFILAWWILSAVKSLQFVFAAGGNGWKVENHQDLKQSKPTAQEREMV